MSSTPRPPTSSGSQDSPEETPSLEMGLAALKQKQYQQAIALLETISESQPHRSVGVRAQMGLVVAYERTRNIEKAIALCEGLTQHPKAKVQAWAKKTLQELKDRYSFETQPQKEKTAKTLQDPGFVPFEPSSQPPNVEQPKDIGFVPFESPLESTPEKPSVDAELNSLHSTVPKSPLNFESKPPQNKPKNQNKNQINPPFIQTSSLPITPTKIDNIIEEKPLTEVQSLSWLQADRAKGWKRLKSLKLTRFYIELALTVYAFLWFLPRLVDFFMDTTNDFLLWLPFVRPSQLLYRNPTQFVYISLAVLFVFSPWLLDGLLKWAYGMKNLPMTTLFNRSQEANKILRSYCQQRNWKMPALKVLPTEAPIAMTYGWLPRFARIVVSQGLLDQLSEDEIATIYAREIASLGQWDFIVMSFATMVLQIPYQIYWQFANWVEHSESLIDRLPRFIPTFVKNILLKFTPILNGIYKIISPLSYGLYRILRLPIYWVSRRRIYFHDRTACNLTGNPNGLSRAIVKIAIGMANEIENRGTSSLLEGFDLLMPVSYKQAIIFSSLRSCGQVEPLLNWDLNNPYGKWLEINNTHPRIGDRLLILSYYAQFWKLNTEFNLTVEKSTTPPLQKYSRLLLQGAPYFGIPAGLMLGSLLWFLGGIFSTMGVWQLEWLFGDFWILAGCIPLGCSLGLFVRINSFFPDIKSATVLDNPNLVNLLTDANTLPIDSQPLRIKGKLIGRKDLSNLMEQDLILQTSTGLIKLHYIPVLTPLANFGKFKHPVDVIGESMNVTGWWRRGATAWIDVETMETEDRQVILTAGHPIWSTILACAIAFWGAYMISQGGF